MLWGNNEKLFIICACTFLIGLLSNPSIAVEYCKDFLEPGNPGGENSLKTWDEEWTLNPWEEVEIDIWVNDLPAGLSTCGFWITYDPSCLELLSIEVYHSPITTWDPGFTGYVDQPAGPGTYMVTVGEFAVAPIDDDGDILLSKIVIAPIGGNTDCNFTIQTIPEFDTSVGGVDGVTVFDPQVTPNTVTIYKIIRDTDTDGTLDHEDNCPLIPNGPDLGICMEGSIRGLNCTTHEDCGMNGFCESDICEYGTIIGTSCTSDEDCGAGGNCSLDQDEYVCNCVGSFDCDYDVDGTDAAHFKMHFGRSPYNNPCTNELLCNGDFECDCDVDGTDAAQFKNGFGSGVFCFADYSASCMGACLSCIDGIYAYTCNYEQ